MAVALVLLLSTVVMILMSPLFVATAEEWTVRYNRDLTLERNAEGPDVVDACIQKISQSHLFPYDQQLLWRIAHIESAITTQNPSKKNQGGIWQISSDKFFRTQLYIDSETLKGIQRVYNIDWYLLYLNNMDVPLYSALGARLFIDQHFDLEDIPLSTELVEQGNFWATEYTDKGESSQFFVNSIRNTTLYKDEKKYLCEVIYLVGLHNLTNSSVISQLFHDLTLRIGGKSPSKKARIGFVLYNENGPFFEIEVNTDLSFQDLLTAIDSISFNTTSKLKADWINDALHFIYDKGFSKDKTNTVTTKAIPKAAIVVTDMEIDTDILTANKHVFTYILLLGNNTDALEMEELQSSSPRLLTRLSVEYNLDEINEFKEAVLYDLYRASPSVDKYNTVFDVLMPKQIKYFNFPYNSEDGATIKVLLVSNLTEVYVSTVIRNPNSAVYDIAFQGPIRMEHYFNVSNETTLESNQLYFTVENNDPHRSSSVTIVVQPGNDLGVPASVEALTAKPSSSGRELLLECVVTGNPEPTVTMYREQDQLVPGNGVTQFKKQLSRFREKVTFSVLSPTSADSGTYHCIATNVFFNLSSYNDSMEHDIIVIGAGGGGGGIEDIATHIHVDVLDDKGDVKVSWSPPERHKVLSYRLFYRLVSGVNCTNGTIDKEEAHKWKMVLTNDTSVTLKHLAIHCKYEFKVQSILVPLPEPHNNMTAIISFSSSSGFIPINDIRSILLLTAGALLILFVATVMCILLVLQASTYATVFSKIRQSMKGNFEDFQKLTDEAMDR